MIFLQAVFTWVLNVIGYVLPRYMIGVKRSRYFVCDPIRSKAQAKRPYK